MRVLVCLIATAAAFVAPPPTSNTRSRVVVRGFFGDLQQNWKQGWEEFDNVMDDFMNKRLGGGEIYYGARTSKFYGEDDRVRSNEEFGKYEGKGYSDRRRMEEANGRAAEPKWVGDSLKEGSYWDGTGKDARRAQRIFGKDKDKR